MFTDLFQSIKPLPMDKGMAHFFYLDYTNKEGEEMTMIVPIMYTNIGEYINTND